MFREKKLQKKQFVLLLQLSSVASYSMLGRAVVVRCLWSLAPGPAQTTLCHATAAPWGFASGAAPARPATASRAAPFSGTLRMPRLRYWVETAARVRGGGWEVRSMGTGAAGAVDAEGAGTAAAAAAAAMMREFSIETTPGLSTRIEDHRALLPPGTPVYVAAIPGKRACTGA